MVEPCATKIFQRNPELWGWGLEYNIFKQYETCIVNGSSSLLFFIWAPAVLLVFTVNTRAKSRLSNDVPFLTQYVARELSLFRQIGINKIKKSIRIKPWPNGLASRRKLTFRLATHLTCIHFNLR